MQNPSRYSSTQNFTLICHSHLLLVQKISRETEHDWQKFAGSISPLSHVLPRSYPAMEAMYTGQNLSTGSKKQISYFSKKIQSRRMNSCGTERHFLMWQYWPAKIICQQSSVSDMVSGWICNQIMWQKNDRHIKWERLPLKNNINGPNPTWFYKHLPTYSNSELFRFRMGDFFSFIQEFTSI